MNKMFVKDLDVRAFVWNAALLILVLSLSLSLSIITSYMWMNVDLLMTKQCYLLSPLYFWRHLLRMTSLFRFCLLSRWCLELMPIQLFDDGTSELIEKETNSWMISCGKISSSWCNARESDSSYIISNFYLIHIRLVQNYI